MAQWNTYFQPGPVQVWAGTTPVTDPGYINDVLCHTGHMEGIFDCGFELDAQYIIFMKTEVGQTLGFAEILAWNAPLLSSTSAAISSISYTGMSYDPSGTGKVERLFGLTDYADTFDCPRFTMNAVGDTMAFSLPSSSTVHEILVQGDLNEWDW